MLEQKTEIILSWIVNTSLIWNRTFEQILEGSERADHE